MCGQMGNQIYRYASLYAMGKLLKRTPVYLHNETILLKMEEEFSKIFPNFYKRIYYLRPDFDEIEKFRLIQSCCDFVDPEIILQTNHSTSKGLKLIGGPNFINYKYFDHLRNDILEIFKFNEDVILNISQLWNNTKLRLIFKNII
ncbi:unnamed protein product [Meloidogyne enterolobii]|uniref:Uncharacterized protein n=1 Tax=Meloidogyne enterolobii TaxID=390850 RepID=A0ACB1B7H1_MELEN